MIINMYAKILILVGVVVCICLSYFLQVKKVNKMEYETIYENNEKFTAFPNPDEVFTSELEKETLIAIGIYHLDEDGKHDVLLAAPLGDEEGMIGKKNLGEFCGESWLTYSIKNGKWTLDCTSDDLLSFEFNSANAKKSLREQRELFKLNGYLPHPWGQVEKMPLFNPKPYASNNYNWYIDIRDQIQHKLEPIEGQAKKVVLLDGNGHEYIYLGFVDASTYARPLLARLEFFYNKDSKRVLVIHEFS